MGDVSAEAVVVIVVVVVLEGEEDRITGGDE